MPYNTTAIPPRKEPTGQTQLPLSRVRKIIALDPDVSICSSNAAFVITLATELFIQYISSEAENMVKLDRKPRRNVQYRDLANAVNRVDRLEFLEDTVPVTVPFGRVKRDAAAAQAKLRSGGTVGGDTTGTGPKGRGRAAGGGVESATGGGGGGSRSKARSSTGGAPPTAISALMANGESGSGGGSGPGKKRQQVLSFSILNGDDEHDDDTHTHTDKNNNNNHGGRAGLTFRSAAPSSGVAAAAALAQAAAASGAVQDDSGPDAQLEQDMQRARDDGSGQRDVSRRDGTARLIGADVDMLDS
ncbi:cbf nf-y family transcription factor [Sporothrix brasiliensis 5110]|uniref:Cbf nf-y family transcription factor n=1 Tax=Sporothrix brasiliensis 5110 TaxID=1398154 RepID=A0A0C2IMP3_9PEZI|nr:cbf nf-y family transcription factor [Sporothrix brasiliensis 5110]KIH90311.1 cbf nf-y family transcription factor [Sporothrix brasiliensis 5110]